MYVCDNGYIDRIFKCVYKLRVSHRRHRRAYYLAACLFKLDCLPYIALNIIRRDIQHRLYIYMLSSESEISYFNFLLTHFNRL